MLGFMTFIEKDGDFIAGYLGTDDELTPIEFIYTEPISPPTRLDRILHGAKFELKWFGDVIAGTLYEGAKKSKNAETRPIKVIFVSHDQMLNLRRKTAEIPVIYINDKNETIAHEDYAEDSQAVAKIMQGRIDYSNTQEVFGRIREGIEEAISLSEETATS